MVFAAGLVANLWLAAEWWQASLGALEAADTLRYGLWGLAGMVLGLQILSNGFFLALLHQCPPGPEVPAPGGPCAGVLALPGPVRDGAVPEASRV